MTSASTRDFPPNSSRSHPPSTTLTRANSAARTNAVLKLKRAASQRTANAVTGTHSQQQSEEEERGRSQTSPSSLLRAGSAAGNYARPGAAASAAAAGGLVGISVQRMSEGDAVSPSTSVESLRSSPVFIRGRHGSHGNDYSPESSMHPFPAGGLSAANVSTDSLGRPGSSNSHNIERSARSPLPSLEQLRARILHERATSGLARSASTGAANAASAAARAYAMDKLLGGSGHGHDLSDGTANSSADGYHFLDTKEPNAAGFPKGRAPSPTMPADNSSAIRDRAGLRRSRTIGSLSAMAEAQRKAAFLRDATDPPDDSANQTDGQLRRQPSQREIARTQMIRKLSARRGAGRGAGNSSDGSSPGPLTVDQSSSQSASARHSPESLFASTSQVTMTSPPEPTLGSNSSSLTNGQLLNPSPGPSNQMSLHPLSASLPHGLVSPLPSNLGLGPASSPGHGPRGPTAMSFRSEDEGHFQYERLMGTGSSTNLLLSPNINSNAPLDSALDSSPRRPSTPEPGDTATESHAKDDISGSNRKARQVWSGANDFARHSFGISSPHEDAEAAMDVPVSPPRESMMSSATVEQQTQARTSKSSRLDSGISNDTTGDTVLERNYEERVPLTLAPGASPVPASWRDTQNSSLHSEMSSDGRLSRALAARSSLTPTRPTLDLPDAQYLTTEALQEQNALLQAGDRKDNDATQRSRSRSPANWTRTRRKSTVDSITDDGSKDGDGEEFDVDAYLYSDSDYDDGDDRSGGTGDEAVKRKSRAMEDRRRTAQGNAGRQHLAVPTSEAGINPKHTASPSALKDLGGERPSERLQALLGESFVREYGAPSDFDQSSPLRENRLPDWERATSDAVAKNAAQPPSPEVQQAWETNGYQKAHDKWLQAELEADVASHRWSEQTTATIAESQRRTARDAKVQHAQSLAKPPVPTSQVPARLLSNLEQSQEATPLQEATPKTPMAEIQRATSAGSPLPQNAALTATTELETPRQNTFYIRHEGRDMIPTRIPSGASTGERTPSSGSYHPPTASPSELGSYYANDKLRPFPGLSAFAQGGEGRPRAAQTPPAPLILNQTPSTISKTISTAAPLSPPLSGSTRATTQSPTFFSSLRRKVTGSRPKDKSDKLEDDKEKPKGHSRTGSSSGNRLFSNSSLRRAASFGTAKARSRQAAPITPQPPSEVHIISRQGSAAFSDQSRENSVVSVLSPDISRDADITPERPGSETLQNGEAEADAPSVDVSALTPATAAKLRRYSHILTASAAPHGHDAAIAAAAYPNKEARAFAKEAFASEENATPGISSVVALDPPRKYLLGGPVYQVVSETLVKDRYLFLFDDLLVVAKAVRSAATSTDPSTLPQSPQGRPLPDLSWIFSVKSIIELRQVQLSMPKEHVATPRAHPLMPTFVRQFLVDPTEALEYIIANSSLPRDASTVAQLLFHTPELDRDHLTAYLCAPERRNVLQAYVSLYKLGGISIESALRTFLIEVRFPTSTEEFDALLLTFAQYWAEANEAHIQGAFTAQMSADLVFAMMALNDAIHSGSDAATPDLFSAPAPDITQEAFVESFRARDPEMVISDRILLRIFASIAAEPMAQALGRNEQYRRLPVRVEGVLPSKLTFAVPCQPIVVSIPEPDPNFSIRLYGQDLVFNPPILTFDTSATQSFTIVSKSLGQRHAVFVRVGKNASRYVSYPLETVEGPDRGSKSEPPKETTLPRSLALTIERAFVRNSFSVTLAAAASATQATRWRYTFSVVDDKARADWAQRIKSAIHASSRRRRHQDAKQRAADSIALNVLRQALIEREGANSSPSASTALQRSVSAASPAARVPPGKTMALDRNISTSKHYYGAQGVGRLERDLLPSPSLLESSKSADTEINSSLRRAATQLRDISPSISNFGRLQTMAEDVAQPGGQQPAPEAPVSKDTVGDALILTCQQNSLLPLVLERMKNETE